MKYNNRIGKPYYYEIKFPELVEIDNYEDLILARKYANYVTLRDGGHVRDFNWPINLLRISIHQLAKLKKSNI